MNLSHLMRLLVAAVLVLGGCSDEVPTRTASGSGGGASAGSQGGACYPNGTCNGVLDCIDGRCEGASADTGIQCNVFTGEGCEDTGTVDTGSVDTRGCPAGYVRIAPGTFTMGSPDAEEGRVSDETQHNVTITRAFCMKATEVTQGEWQAEMGDNPSSFQECGPNCPVEKVSWDDAVLYANALSRREGLPECYAGSTFSGLDCGGYRLPTESEWEYAARGGTTTATYLGNLSGTVSDCSTAQANLDGIAWWCGNAGGRTQAVGGKTSNAFGLWDMLGNVWEWTGDLDGTYPATVTDPTGPTTGSNRVFRGGSWGDSARIARAAIRFYGSPFFRDDGLGFRLSRTAP